MSWLGRNWGTDEIVDAGVKQDHRWPDLTASLLVELHPDQNHFTELEFHRSIVRRWNPRGSMLLQIVCVPPLATHCPRQRHSTTGSLEAALPEVFRVRRLAELRSGRLR